MRNWNIDPYRSPWFPQIGALLAAARRGVGSPLHDLSDESRRQRTANFTRVPELLHGQDSAYGVAAIQFFAELYALKEVQDILSGAILLDTNGGWCLPRAGASWMAERHCGLQFDAEQRLHCEDGPALAYPDGWALHYWHGVNVPSYVIEKPEQITVQDIDNERNTEIRRIKIERYGGVSQYFRDSGAAVVHTDNCGVLYRRELPRGEPVVMVRVVNATAEPDGRYKDYWLRVPPDMRTAREAVAWTFQKREHEYAPTTET